MTRPILLINLLVAVAALVPACEPVDESREAVVSAFRAPCTGLEPMLCLVYTEDGGEPELSYDSFEGFSHRWGVETRLLFHTETVEDPPADGSSIRSIADEILAETPEDPGTTFDLSFPEESPGTGWFVASGDRLRMIDTEVACEPAVCTEILEHTAAGTAFTATFELLGDTDVPLRAVSLGE